MILTLRDKLIIETIKSQDFCFYKDIEKSFFSSKYSAYNRLKDLKKQGYIAIEPFNLLYLQKDLDSSCLNFIGMNRKYICLHEKDENFKKKDQQMENQASAFAFFIKR